MAIKRAVIFVNGELKDHRAAKALLREDDFLVAADGGLRHMETMGLRAGLIIGDLDSATPELVSRVQAAGSEVRRYPKEKDETDLELALQAVVTMGYRSILILAALGSRLDQTLGNMLLLTLPTLSDCEVRLDDGEVEVFLIHKEGSIEGKPGDTISLIPLDGPVQVVSTSGLRYPLKQETFAFGRTRGISNEMLGVLADVRIDQGRLLCIHTRKGVER